MVTDPNSTEGRHGHIASEFPSRQAPPSSEDELNRIEIFKWKVPKQPLQHFALFSLENVGRPSKLTALSFDCQCNPHPLSPLHNVEEEAIRWPLPRKARTMEWYWALTLMRKDKMMHWIL